MHSAEDLRKKYPEFIFDSFELNFLGSDLQIRFNFWLSPDLEFQTTLTFPGITEERINQIGKAAFENLVFNLGMAEALSYWKATCSPLIKIKAGRLTPEQIEFWNNLLIQGLGEFFYQNQIDFTEKQFIRFEADNSSAPEIFSQPVNNRSLVMVGGGKDSAVTLEIFRQSEREFAPLILNPTQAALSIASSTNLEPIIISRTIDPKLIGLNSQGFLNGHTPFSGYLAFLGVLAGAVYDFEQIVVSNESSASEPTLEWLSRPINHQYSKSFEFEKDFANYCTNFLAPSIHYFSFLRPLTELQIARLFARMPEYHQMFRSCNQGSKQGIWCGNCAKCLFAYLILYPYLGDKTAEIFGQDLFNKPELLPLIKQLIRAESLGKPFDCVGMADETKLALYLSIEKYREASEELPPLLKLSKELLDADSEFDVEVTKKQILNSWNQDNNLSPEFASLLKNNLTDED